MEICTLKDLAERVKMYCASEGGMNGSMRFLGASSVLGRGERLSFQYTFFREKRSEIEVVYDLGDEDFEVDSQNPMERGVGLLGSYLGENITVSSFGEKADFSRLKVRCLDEFPISESDKVVVSEVERGVLPDFLAEIGHFPPGQYESLVC